MIPVIDVFAGPGGLSEGFAAPIDGAPRFDVRISVELTTVACKTLATRAFYREFRNAGRPLPEAYYAHLRGEISQEALFDMFPNEAKEARERVCQAELGTESGNQRVAERLPPSSVSNPILIGGPPCQAYSLVGRSRSLGAAVHAEDPDAARRRFYSDVRHTLYREYLRLIREYKPAIFVMENVRGILSAKLQGKAPVFDIIRKDLHEALGKPGTYELYSFRVHDPINCDGAPETFLLHSEDYGVPQRRHRVIILGLRKDVAASIGHRLPSILKVRNRQVTVRDVIGDMPIMTSKMSFRGLAKTSVLNSTAWAQNLNELDWGPLERHPDFAARHQRLVKRQRSILEAIADNQGPLFMPQIKNNELNNWYQPENMGRIPCANHEPRTHMFSDIRRYRYISLFTELEGRSPRLADLPDYLLPNHANVIRSGSTTNQSFADRFKTQAWDKPSTTITCHISKDGHYFIHPDPAQARCLTVREAARLQTFPDDYFFEGNRTEQYHQVGNAVPSYLAHQLAEIVYKIYTSWRKSPSLY